MQINLMIDEAFRKKGIEKIYTFAITDEQYRYNQYLGYKPTGKEAIIPNFDGHAYEFEKDLTL